MKTAAILAGVLCLLAGAFALAAQDVPKLNGMWNVTINSPDGTTTEQWNVQQDGIKLTGKVKNSSGELPLEGSLEGTTMRVRVTNGDMQYLVHGTVDGDSIDGTIRMGKNEFLWRAKRAKSS